MHYAGSFRNGLFPSRMVAIAKCAEALIREFFDQNPLSHIGIVTTKDGITHRLTDVGGGPESQIKAPKSKLNVQAMLPCKML